MIMGRSSNCKVKDNLEDVIFLFFCCVCKDLLHIAVVLARNHSNGAAYMPGKISFVTLQDRVKLEKEALVKLIVKCSTAVRFCSGVGPMARVKMLSETHSKLLMEYHSEDEDNQLCIYRASTVKHKSSITIPMIILTAYLQYSYQGGLIGNTYQFSVSRQLEIKGSAKIDVEMTDIYGITFAQVLNVDHKLPDKSHYLVQEAKSFADILSNKVSHQMFMQNILLSNSTDTEILLSAANDPVGGLIYIAAICSMILTYITVLISGQSLNPIEKKLNRVIKRVERTPRSLIVNLKGSPNTGYCADMSFGNSSIQEFCMLVDTGSANLAVAAKQLPEVNEFLNTQMMMCTRWLVYFLEYCKVPMYRSEGSIVATNTPVSMSYSGGSWSGTLAKGSVSIGGSPKVEVDFALIESSSMFFIPGAEWEGILGLAYDSLAKPDSSVRTFWSTLQESSGMRDMFTLRICPQINFVSQGGVMEFGDISDNLYTGLILYTSVTTELYYNVLVTNLTVGNAQINLPCSEFNNDQAFIDSGTTDIYLPSMVFKEVIAVFKKHFKETIPLVVPDSFWNGDSKLSWPTDSKEIIFEAFPTFYVGLAEDGDQSSEFSLAITPQTYLRQVSGSQEEMEQTKCLPQCDFFIFGIKSRERGMVLGGNLLLGFTTVFDREQKRMGFAKSTCKYADSTPGHIPYVIGPYPREPVDCQCYGLGCSKTFAYWEWIVYTCGTIVSIICTISIACAIVRSCINRKDRISICCRRHFRYTCSPKHCCRKNYGTLIMTSPNIGYAQLHRQDSTVSSNSTETNDSGIGNCSGPSELHQYRDRVCEEGTSVENSALHTGLASSTTMGMELVSNTVLHLAHEEDSARSALATITLFLSVTINCFLFGLA